MTSYLAQWIVGELVAIPVPLRKLTAPLHVKTGESGTSTFRPDLIRSQNEDGPISRRGTLRETIELAENKAGSLAKRDGESLHQMLTSMKSMMNVARDVG